MGLNQQGHFIEQETEAKTDIMITPQIMQLVCAGAGNESQDFGLHALHSTARRGTGHHMECSGEQERR